MKTGNDTLHREVKAAIVKITGRWILKWLPASANIHLIPLVEVSSFVLNHARVTVARTGNKTPSAKIFIELQPST